MLYEPSPNDGEASSVREAATNFKFALQSLSSLCCYSGLPWLPPRATFLHVWAQRMRALRGNNQDACLTMQPVGYARPQNVPEVTARSLRVFRPMFIFSVTTS
jgi:hypothetical protein